MGAPTKNKPYAEEISRKDFLREIKIKRAYYDLETRQAGLNIIP